MIPNQEGNLKIHQWPDLIWILVSNINTIMDELKQLVILPLLLNTVRRKRNVHIEKHRDEGWGGVVVARSGSGIYL